MRTAILFKTHFWDDFTRRQLARLQANTRDADIIICVDETGGTVGPIDAPLVLRTTDRQLLAMGLPDARTHGSLLWFSIDYLHCYVFQHYPDYDYYLALEYDAVINLDVDAFVAAAAADGADFVGFPMRTPIRQWAWAALHAPIYGADLRAYLSCIALFSNRAMQLLMDRRLSMARDFRTGSLAFWPYTEAFIPSELQIAGYRLRSLTDYGATDHYDWWPPVHEADLASLADQGFVHPVLEGGRYIASVLRHDRQLFSYFLPSSLLRQRLARFPRQTIAPYVRREFRRRLGDAVQRRLEALGLRRKWYQGAASVQRNLPQHDPGPAGS
jgi:hypothetical protein